MATVKENTLVRNPESGRVCVINAGDDIPDWAVQLVPEHLVDGDLPEADQADGDAGEYLGQTAADLKAEAARRNIAREAAGLDLLPVKGTKAVVAAALAEDDAAEYDREVADEPSSEGDGESDGEKSDADADGADEDDDTSSDSAGD